MTNTKELSTKEKVKCSGPSSLTNKELIGLVLRNGKRNTNPFVVAETMTEDNNFYQEFTRNHSIAELLNLYDLTETQALAIVAAVELGRRILNGKGLKKIPIKCPGDAAHYLWNAGLQHESHEKFVVLLLNAKNQILRKEQIAEGTLTSTCVHPREVFATAIVNHAASLIAAHNHPSGDPAPSDEDTRLTQALQKAGEIIGIPVMDHVIIGDGRYYSFKEHGLL